MYFNSLFPLVVCSTFQKSQCLIFIACLPCNKKTFIATPRQWGMLGIDSLAWNGSNQGQQAMLLYTTQQLSI
jgi:hypothetical protein